MDQCHITGRAHETSDPIQPVLVAAGCMAPLPGTVYSQTWSAVQSWIGAAETWTFTVGFLQTRSLSPGDGFIPALSDKGEAFAPGRTDGLCDRQKFADACSTSGH